MVANASFPVLRNDLPGVGAYAAETSPERRTARRSRHRGGGAGNVDPRAGRYRVVQTVPLRVKTAGRTFGPLYSPTKPIVVDAPVGSEPLCDSLTTLTREPSWVQTAFQPLLRLCHVLGQSKVSVQPSIGSPSLVISMAPT